MRTPRVTIEKILYTTDLSETGRHAFALAASLTRRYQARLTVIHVVEEGPELDRRLAGYMKEEVWESIKTRDLAEAREILVNRRREDTAIIRECVGEYCQEIQAGTPDKAYVSYDIVIKLGRADKEILAFAESQGYDLIIVGQHDQGPLDRLLGNTSSRILARATVPVLVVPLPE